MDSGVKTKAYYWIFFVVVTVCLSTAAYALYQETGVPSIPFEENEATGLDAHIEASIDVAGLQVVLEKTSLLDIQKKTGGLIRHQGDAGGSLYFLCYNSKYNTIPIQVWFFSGELGGEGHLIHGLYVQKGAYFTNLASSCTSIKENSISLKIDDEFWIDQNMDVVNKKIGSHSSAEDGWNFYTHTSNEDNEYQKATILGLELHNQRVKSLYLGQTTTN